jgi:glutathione S-transferase
MKLYYATGACSLADRMMLHEAGLAADFERVDLATHVTETGADFRTINPKGYVPALVLDDGTVLTENLAILFWIAGRVPQLAPDGPLGQVRLVEALAFIATEVHKPLKPFFLPETDAAERRRAGAAVTGRLALLGQGLAGPFLLGARFTPADAYLFVMLRWARRFGLAVPQTLETFAAAVAERASVRTALAEEGLPIPAPLRRAG